MAILDQFTVIAIAAVIGMFALMGVLRMGGQGAACAAEGRALWLGRLSMCVVMAAALALAITGFGAPLVCEGGRISKWILLGHVSLGGMFLAGLVGIAIFCSDRYRFGCGPGTIGGAGKRLFFWLALLLGVATSLSVFVSMMPWFSSHALEMLFQAHRWSALGEVMSLIGLALSR